MAQRQTMERADSAMIPPPEQETVIAHISRSSKNAFYSCFGCLQTSKEKTLIKYKEYEIEQRKKAFGVTYINHKKKGEDDQLTSCVETALKDIDSFESEIRDLQAKITAKNEETKSRLVPAPGTPSGAASVQAANIPPPETAVTPSPAAAQENKLPEQVDHQPAAPAETTPEVSSAPTVETSKTTDDVATELPATASASSAPSATETSASNTAATAPSAEAAASAPSTEAAAV